MTERERLILAGLSPHARLHVLSLLAQCPGLTLTSGRRGADRNRAVGGSPRSFHLQGRAADFVADGQTLAFGLTIIRRDRVTPRCTGPEEAVIHDVGSGLHLHAAW
jgi:hypothetical protein